ncbi:MAG: hypothetical protein II889_10135 [Clostridia bacterium]|jgi:hypothetical protein|nr:hypothetical protein [Clostridia bacterium]MCR4906833.1 hypothetical protein [Clostridiales bacterium]
MNRTKTRLSTILSFLLNPRLLLCAGIGWLVTNGWAYILLALGSVLRIGWMIAVSSAYMAFLWFPFTPEKIVTLIIAIALLRLFFPHDRKTLKRLRVLKRWAVMKWKTRKRRK